MDSKKTQASKIYVTAHSKGTYTHYGLCIKPKFITILGLMMLTTLSAWGQFAYGSGTVTDPYRITKPEHLEYFINQVNEGNKYEGQYIELISDFNLGGRALSPIGGKYYKEYNSQNELIGKGERKFCGIFLGNNCTIQNFHINTDGSDFLYTGLFGYLGYGARVYDLTIDNATIKALAYCGGITGYVDSKAMISNCQVGAGVVISVDPNQLGTQLDPNQCFGGIAGVNRGSIGRCTSKATVTSGTSNYANSFGGIVGYNNGEITSCNSIAQVVGTTSVGAIAGESGSNATYSNNYYHCFAGNTPLGAVNGAAVNGNTWIYTVSFAAGVSGNLPAGAVFTDGSTSYFAAGKVMVMAPSYQAEDGYVATAVTYYANGTPLNTNSSGKLQFTMPAEDVVITATCTEQKRDIGYADWVKVSIPKQRYTGSALTPVITMTDTKDGGSTVLSEGTHYTVTLPGEMTAVGNYNITLTGIGDFAGTRTEQFSITGVYSHLWQGEGTAESPYLIATNNEMYKIAGEMPDDGYEGVYFRLEADLPDFQTSTVIGVESKPFNGTFDGNGHSININLSAADEFYSGLFGVVGNDGKVMNLTLDGSINGKDTMGGIAGMNYGTIENCIFHGRVEYTKRIPNAGGIVGYNNGTVKNCLSTGNIESNVYAGGIAGYNDYEGALIGNLVIGATINAYSAYSAQGAIAGYVNVKSTATSNYYYNCTVGSVANATNVGTDNGDRGGLRSIHVLTLADGIIATGETITYNNQLYAASNTEVTLSTSAGYAVSDIVSSDVNISENNTFTMPAQDVTISATSTPLTTLNLTANLAALNGVTKYWTTFYHPALSYELPPGAMALYMKEDMALYMLGDGNVVPAGTPVIIMGEAASIELKRVSDPSITVADNILQGTSTATAAGANTYVLNKDADGNFGLFKFEGTIPANKAFFINE